MVPAMYIIHPPRIISPQSSLVKVSLITMESLATPDLVDTMKYLMLTTDFRSKRNNGRKWMQVMVVVRVALVLVIHCPH